MSDNIDCEVIRDKSINPDKAFKVIVIGEAFVGKSSIMIRGIKDEYIEDYEVTVGADSGTFLSRINQENVQLQIWDTAGSEKFRSMIHVFFTKSEGALLVYDITKKESFDALDYWLKMLRDNTTPDISIILVGNKKDQEELRQVKHKDGEKYAYKNALMKFIETSAKTGEGVIDTFKILSKALYSKKRAEVKENNTSGIKLNAPENTKNGCC